MSRGSHWAATRLAAISLVLASSAAFAAKTKPVLSEESLGFTSGSRAALLGTIKRVGLLPVHLPPAFEDREDSKREIQDAVAKYLRLAGMEVVGPETYTAALDRLNREAGGIFDAHTGALKPEVATRVRGDALRAFLAKEHLDGWVILRVLARSAPYRKREAAWDGVHDRSDGQEGNGVWKDFIEGSAYEGRVPVLSLNMQIIEQERVVFGRSGGIQPTGYFEEANYMEVKPKALLRDVARFDRAAQVVTAPLRFSSQELAKGEKIKVKNLPPLPEAWTPGYRSALLVPREQILASVHRVVLAPIDTGGYYLPKETTERWRSTVCEELESLGWEVIDPLNARRATHSTVFDGDIFDPLTGKRDEARAAALRRAVMNELGKDAPIDAVFWLTLVRSSARYMDSTVFWDGISQDAESLGAPVDHRDAKSELSATGGIEVASLAAYLEDANDVALYRARGGLQVLEKMQLKVANSYQAGAAELTAIPTWELFRDPIRDRRAVRAALRELTGSPAN